MKYTESMQNEIMIALEKDLDGDNMGDAGLEFLNSKDGLRSFGDGLLTVISSKYSDVNINNVIAKIKDYAKSNGIPLKEIAAENTLANWFKNDKRPKKGDMSRGSMFALAFAMNFNVAETKYLFENVYLDRAFDYRKEKELIYYFCLKAGKTWVEAKDLIEKAKNLTKQYEDKTILTLEIQGELKAINDEEALLSYIATHGHNFEKNNVKAKKVFAELLSRAKTVALIEVKKMDKGLPKGKWNPGEEISNNFLFEIITDQKASSKAGTKTIFNNAALPQEITSRFPEAGTFSKTDMTYEEIRKAIILLHFYNYCIDNWNETDFDEFVEEMNNILNDCCLSELYPGNPFDWLFLYSMTYEDYPLDVFRGVIAEALYSCPHEE